MHQPKQDEGGREMLQKPQLVAEVAEEAKARDDHPTDSGPRAEAVLDHGHPGNLELDKVRNVPLAEEK